MTKMIKRPNKILNWQATKKNPPKMEYFADQREIDYNRDMDHIHGLSVDVEVSYLDPPEGMVHEAELYIPFEGRIKWLTHELGKGPKEMGEPKFWRERCK